MDWQSAIKIISNSGKVATSTMQSVKDYVTQDTSDTSKLLYVSTENGTIHDWLPSLSEKLCEDWLEYAP